MNAGSFNELSMYNKILLVDDLAAPVCSIEYYDHRIYLYSLNALFIESYHNIDTGEIEKICTVDYADLDKYLSRITLYQGLRKKQTHN
ncbi:hypothetical protein KK083_19230 [Fulvivirgaceae bacterium PWU4]|uniref:Uncharacterized protein n=1 Tax=Chryseosolibacter histidini TaxID=2782349 RepID=A0AAP2GK73_9BACT|nr:hypothetical protein [Chryseosolibacter histidini]MBT1699036.1 hypothetical protein [Chryseosolibacter histidini]